MPSSSPSSLAVTWVLATISGYGIYGLQIVLQFLRRGGQNVILTQAPAVTVVPPLVYPKLEPIFDLGKKLSKFLQENPKEILAFDHAALHGCSSDFTGFVGQDRIIGKPNVACCAIEHLFQTDHGKAVSKNYDMFIAISRWNADYLKSLNLHGPVHLCYQGIDNTMFQPGPRSDLYHDRFVIFSGGKFEFRKGQDIVVAAFKRFRERHPDALLVTCWQNLLPPNATAFELAGHVKGVPQAATDYGIAVTPWLLEQGLPQGSFIDLPYTHNFLMPWVLRECDIAVFPNRCEGGTNLVAMEAMACGVPTYVAYNTGQKDLVDLIGCGAFKTQRTVKSTPQMNTLQDWGETDVDEVVEAMETVYTRREDTIKNAKTVAEKVARWEWGSLNEKFLQIVCDGKTPEIAGGMNPAPKPFVVVGTPCFGGMVTQDYTMSLLNLQAAAPKAGFDMAVVMLGNDALITRGRSAIVAKFLDAPQATHLLFIDADIAFSPEQVARMLAFDKDFVAGLYPAKIIDWQQSAARAGKSGEAPDEAGFAYVGDLCTGAELKNENGFATGIYAGTGFQLIKRNVFERMKKAYPETKYKALHAFPRPSQPSDNLYALFDCMIDPETGVYLSEDYVFCRRWRAIGGEIWLDLQSRLTHMGSYHFRGNAAARF